MSSEEILFRAFLASLDEKTRGVALQRWPWAARPGPCGECVKPLAWHSTDEQYYRLQRAYAAWLEDHGDVRGEFVRVLCELAEARARPRLAARPADLATEAVFLRDIEEHPGDATPWLVLADWLEERGDARGTEVRLLARVRALAPLVDPEWLEVLGLPRRESPTPGPYQRFTDRILERAEREADRRFRHDYVGTQHALVALTRETHRVVGEVLSAAGLTPLKVQEQVRRITPPGPDGGKTRMPYSTSMRQAVFLAEEEANAMRQSLIGPEYLLLGLCRAQPCAAARVLGNLGVTPRALALSLLGRLGVDGAAWLRGRPEVW